MKGKVILVDGLKFLGVTESGRTLVLQSSTEPDRMAPPPMQVLLVTLGACTAMDVKAILDRLGQRVEGMELRLSATRAKDHPRVFKRIVITYSVRGDVEEEKLKEAIRLSQDKFCPVSAHMKASGVEIVTRWEIIRS
ncbi:MAG: OsmC family peroxiredoxin [Thermoplasmata archaeon]|nr:MAG: OsmC family peroxiredoxin [Thermoplasmata archaeon]